MKACIPVFTVLVCTAQGQRFPLLIYVSLIPICAGVILASGSDLDFSLAGLMAALTSALAQTFMNISIKGVRNATGYSGSKAFLGMAIISSVLTVPIMLMGSSNPAGSSVGADAAADAAKTSIDVLRSVFDKFQTGDRWPLILTVLAALAYHIEYALNFVFVGYVSAVTFSVSDIARRIAIILTGAVVFNKTLTMQNWLGISVALGGVLWYSYLENAYKPAAPAPAPAPVAMTGTASLGSSTYNEKNISSATARARNSKHLNQ